MSFHKVVDWFIPCSPVGAYTGCIPPVGVEFSIPETHYLCESVERGLEDGKKPG